MAPHEVPRMVLGTPAVIEWSLSAPERPGPVQVEAMGAASEARESIAGAQALLWLQKNHVF